MHDAKHVEIGLVDRIDRVADQLRDINCKAREVPGHRDGNANRRYVIASPTMTGEVIQREKFPLRLAHTTLRTRTAIAMQTD